MPTPSAPLLPSAADMLGALGYLSDDGARLGSLSPLDALELAATLTTAAVAELRP